MIRSPYPPANAIAYDASLGAPPELPKQPFTVDHFFALWPVRFLAYVGGVTLTLHTLAVAIGLNGAVRWMLAFAVPVVADAVWKWYSVNRLGYHPGSMSVWGHVQIGFLINSFSCMSLAAIFAIQRLRRGSTSTKQD